MRVSELEDREMEMRGVRRRVARGADIPDHVSTFDRGTIAQTRFVVVEVSIVVTVAAGRIVLVDGVPALLALEQLRDRAVVDRAHQRSSWCQEVQRLVAAAVP